MTTLKAIPGLKNKYTPVPTIKNRNLSTQAVVLPVMSLENRMIIPLRLGHIDHVHGKRKPMRVVTISAKSSMRSALSLIALTISETVVMKKMVADMVKHIPYNETKSKRYTRDNSEDEGLVTKNAPDEIIRLNRFIANSGICSRREADDLITNGMITVNGKVVTELGTKVRRDDEVVYKGKRLTAERKVYILLNKPKDYVTTVDDPHAKHTVMELIEGACDVRVYPVGRLDRNSSGVLLLTNDGDLTTRLTHPSFKKRKIYHVGLDRKVNPNDLDKILKGIELDDEKIQVDAIDYVEGSDGSEIGIEIHSGQNRIVRRILNR